MKELRIYSFTLIVLMEVLFSVAVAGSSANVYESDEFLIDTSIVYVPAFFDQKFPSVAFDGTNYLVVWQGVRSDSSLDIYGTRVNQSGTVLDPAGIAISVAIDNQTTPSIAFDGINYLVVWTDQRNGDFDIYGTRVNQAGVVLDTNGIAISTAEYIQEFPSVAFDGISYLVVWTDGRNGSSDVYGARVSQVGAVLDPTGIVISTEINNQEYPVVAFDGTNYLVAWTDYRHSPYYSSIYGARVNRTGIILDTNGIAISTSSLYQEFPCVAFDGTNYLVVWHDGRGSSFDIYGARVNQAGIVIDSTGLLISNALCNQYNPLVAFDGTNYFVIWQDSRGSRLDIYGARVNQAGVVLDTNGFVLSLTANEQELPCLIFGGVNYMMVWQDYRHVRYNIYGARINQAGTILDTNGIALSTAVSHQLFPSVAFDGINYLLVWQDWRNGSNYDIYGVRINQFGTILDSVGIPISTAASNQSSPSLAFDGTNYLVVWQDRRNGSNYDIYGTRINQNGIVLEPSGITISTATNDQLFPAVSFGDTNFFVIWQDSRRNIYDIYGARISQTGTVLDSNGIGILFLSNQYSPAVAFDGTNYLVIWEGGNYNILGARVNQLGIVLDPMGFFISRAINRQCSASVAFDGANYFAVWTDYRNCDTTSDIYGARINPNGTVIDSNGFAISTAAGHQSYPSVAFDNTNYFIGWEDWRNGYDCDIYGIRLNPSGVIIDSFPVSTQPGAQNSPALACDTGNHVLITYSGWTETVEGKSYNTYRVWGKFYPFVGIEEENSTVKMQSAELLEVYPNPAKGVILVRGPLTVKEIKIFDVTGKLINVVEKATSTQEPIQEMKISLKGINPGIYFLRVGKETKKFLVVK